MTPRIVIEAGQVAQVPGVGTMIRAARGQAGQAAIAVHRRPSISSRASAAQRRRDPSSTTLARLDADRRA